LDVVEDVVEIDLVQVAAPLRHRTRIEIVEAAMAKLAHPVRLILVRRDRIDKLMRKAPPRLEEIVLGDGKAVLDRIVGTDALNDLGLGLGHASAFAGMNGS